MDTILNLTQHNATAGQMEAGVVEPADKKVIQSLLTVSELPDIAEIKRRTDALAAIAASTGITSAMIGGAPWLMSALERALVAAGVVPVYSFSVRKSIETCNADGTVSKTSIFEHGGWVHANVS